MANWDTLWLHGSQDKCFNVAWQKAIWSPQPPFPHRAAVSLWPRRNRTPKLKSLTSQLFRRHKQGDEYFMSDRRRLGALLHMWRALICCVAGELCPRRGRRLSEEKGQLVWETRRVWSGQSTTCCLTRPAVNPSVHCSFLSYHHLLLITRPPWVKGLSVSFPSGPVTWTPDKSESEVIYQHLFSYSSFLICFMKSGPIQRSICQVDSLECCTPWSRPQDSQRRVERISSISWIQNEFLLRRFCVTIEQCWLSDAAMYLRAIQTLDLSTTEAGTWFKNSYSYKSFPIQLPRGFWVEDHHKYVQGISGHMSAICLSAF